MDNFLDTLLTVECGSKGLEAYREEISRLHPLAESEEYLLAKRYFVYRDGNDADRLVDSLLNLVVHHAEDFQKSGLPMLEIIFAGNDGLMKAVRKFNPDRSYRLSGYASWYIRSAIKAYIRRKVG